MRPLVLNYHAFGERSADDDPHHHFVPPDAFAAQLDALLARGWRALDEAAYVAGLGSERWPARSFLITIDDGFASTIDGVEVLARRQVPAIVYIPAGLIGGSTGAWAPEMRDEPLLDAAGIQALLAYGVAVGAHGWDHRPMRDLPPEELRRHTDDARDVLTDLTGAVPRTFAYPGGHHDAAARSAVEAAGFEAAFSVTEGDGRYAISRVDINASDTMRTFAMKCSKWWPAAQSIARRVPRLRRGLHRVVGSAR